MIRHRRSLVAAALLGVGLVGFGMIRLFGKPPNNWGEEQRSLDTFESGPSFAPARATVASVSAAGHLGVPKLVVAPFLREQMPSQAHEQRRARSLATFAAKMGLDEAQVKELATIADDANDEFHSAYESLVATSGSGEDLYKIVSERHEAISRRAIERISRLTSDAQEVDLHRFIGTQMDEETVRLMAAFATKFEGRLAQDEVEIQQEFVTAIRERSKSNH
jgi:hypothetical protein